jgi:phage antirepressor YoqD-like protein
MIMPVVIDDKTFYRTGEVCRLMGVSKNTLFRWLKEGEFGDTEYRDWHGWRLLTQSQLDIVRAKTSHVRTINRTTESQFPANRKVRVTNEEI